MARKRKPQPIVPRVKEGTVAFYFDGTNEEWFRGEIARYGYEFKDSGEGFFSAISDGWHQDMWPEEYILIYPDSSSELVTKGEFEMRYDIT